MTVRWLTAFVDLPDERFERGATFWERVTASTRSAPRGDHDEFATLVPLRGDPHLRVQRIPDPGPRIHLDLHVESIPETRRLASELGARVLDDRGHVLMSSPGGLTFCLVDHAGEATVPPPVVDPAPHRLDQVCIDVPDHLYDHETAFWSALTGWELRASSLRPEFSWLRRPPGMPFRLLLQRLGADDGRTAVTAHLDLACGDGVDDIVPTHEALGARVIERFDYWTLLEDPAGMPYCLTRRPPEPPSGE